MNVLVWVLWGCLAIELPPEPNCNSRVFGWPDADGDGVGDGGAVYVGCDLPDGYVTVPPPDSEAEPPTGSDGTTTPTDTATTDTGLPTTPGTTPTGTDTGAP